jgi:SAM-dependent methyltransferase
VLEDWLDVVGCPSCCSPLLLTDDATWPLRCRGCGERFAVDGRIPLLLRREDADRLARFSRQYREARLAEGWQPLTAEQARALPYGRPPGYPPLYWEVRRQSFCALMSLLAREGPSPAAGPIADLGAGSGWLSYRLAQAGYRVLALEASRDTAFGLGAAEAHYASDAPFLPVQGDLERPPLLNSRLGMLLFNASLHYAADLENTLRRAAQALQPRGRLIILDTPIARQPHPGTGHGDRHLGRGELHQALIEAGLRPRWIGVRRGNRWQSRQLKVWLKREPRFSFPIVAADPT